MTRCRYCGGVIVEADAWGKYWYHPEGQSVYCQSDEPPMGEQPTRAEPMPVKSLKRLTPEGVSRI